MGLWVWEAGMQPKQVMTAVALCSMSGTAFWFGMRDAKPPTRDRRPPDNPTATPNNTGTQPQPQTTIAQPEAFAPKRSPRSPVVTPPSARAGIVVPADRPADYEAQLRQLVAANQLSDRPPDPAAIVAPAPPPSAPSPRIAPITAFSDIQGHWAESSIDYLLARQMLQGFPDGTFRPEQPITERDLAALTAKAAEQSSQPAVTAAVRSRLPNQRITRAQAAVIVYQALATTEPAPIVTRVHVKGAVARPGDYSLAALSSASSSDRAPLGGSLPTVSRAIQQAGGSLAQADLERVKVQRKTDDGTTKTLEVSVGRSPSTATLTPDTVLQQNDTVIIPDSLTTEAPAMPAVRQEQAQAPQPVSPNRDRPSPVAAPSSLAIPPDWSAPVP